MTDEVLVSREGNLKSHDLPGLWEVGEKENKMPNNRTDFVLALWS